MARGARRARAASRREYTCYAVDGDRAAAVGTSTYPHEGRVYDNVFLLRFDGDGRCREFTEWYVKRPDG